MSGTRYRRERPPKYNRYEQQIICKQFGCGKILNPTEATMSEYCFYHSRKKYEEERNKLLRNNNTPEL